MNGSFILYSIKRKISEPNKILFDGAFPLDNPDGRTLHAFVNGKEVEITLKEFDGLDTAARYADKKAGISKELSGEIVSNDRITSLILEEDYQGDKKTICKITQKNVDSLLPMINGNIDYYLPDEKTITIIGWLAVSEDAEIKVLDGNNEISAEVVRKYRKDVRDLFKEADSNSRFGIEIIIPKKDYKNLKIFVRDSICERYLNVNFNKLSTKPGVEQHPRNILKRAVDYFRANGIKATITRTAEKLTNADQKEDEVELYRRFLEKHQVTEDELEEQRKTVFGFQPKISIVIPIYNTPLNFLKELIDSVINQTYSNWQLCLADGSDTNALEKSVKEFSNNDPRVLYHLLGFNDGISNNTNGAIAMADGDFIAFSDHDDLITPNALFEVVKALNSDPEVDCVYTDEDKIDMDGKTLFMPHFKPDLNIDLLCSYNYITHLFVARKSIIDEIGGLHQEFDGSQDHDTIFRCIEKSRKVYHVPKVLYHWRCHKNSTAMNPESKMYCYEAGRDAVQAHLDRIGVPAKVEMASNYGHYITHYLWKEKPLVSIIIPNMNHKDDLDKCVSSILEKSEYDNFEIIIVENNSTDKEIFEYYKTIEANSKIKIVTYKGDFNYSKINNFGVENANGDYLLFLNNDTELCNASGIKEMLDICMRDDVGAVGARLYFADNTVQHAGVILGAGGVANHAFYKTERGDVGYFFRSVSVQDVTAVTAACMLTKRAAFEEVNGFSEDLAVAFNDIDYCLKLRRNNKLIVYTPFSEWYHYESKSRGYEDSPEKVQRLQHETEVFMGRWKAIVEKGDPYYNPNFSYASADYKYDIEG